MSWRFGVKVIPRHEERVNYLFQYYTDILYLRFVAVSGFWLLQILKLNMKKAIKILRFENYVK